MEDLARTDDFEDTCPDWEPVNIQVVPAASSSGTLTSTLVPVTPAVQQDGPGLSDRAFKACVLLGCQLELCGNLDNTTTNSSSAAYSGLGVILSFFSF